MTTLKEVNKSKKNQKNSHKIKMNKKKERSDKKSRTGKKETYKHNIRKIFEDQNKCEG